jgi:antitoxin FitA
MPTLHVRNVPDELHDRIRTLASAQKRSLSAEVVKLLERDLQDEQVRASQQVLLTTIARRRSRRTSKQIPDSVALLREDRNR